MHGNLIFYFPEASLLCKYVVNGLFFFFFFPVSSNPTLVYIIRAGNRIFSYQAALILAKIALQICQICIVCGVHYLLALAALKEFGFFFLLLLLVGQRQNVCLGRLEVKNPLFPVFGKSEITVCVSSGESEYWDGVGRINQLEVSNLWQITWKTLWE